MIARAHARYVAISQRIYAVSNAGAMLVTLAVVIASATSVARFLLSLGVNAGLFAFNLAVNRWIVPRLGPRGDVYRSLVNGVAAGLAYIAIDWPFPVWFWLPFAAITLDQSAGRNGALKTVLVLCGIQSAFAVLDGHRLLEPALFSAFAIVCWAISDARFRVVREMLASAEAQRDELAKAHAEIVAEVAARERAELELRQAQKLEALGRLSAGIAHEINTPMQFITNSVQFVRDGVVDLLEGDEATDRAYLRENLPQALDLAVEGCRRVATIVRSMKHFAHAEGVYASVDLNEIVDATLAIARHEYIGVADLERTSSEIPFVTCNAGEINQVLINLITNAAYAIGDRRTGTRGRITVRTSFVDGGVVISVEDNGTGIPEGVRDRIFDPFFTTKAVGRGTGQGLSISRAMIERHGGTLTFETEVGRGTTFHLRLHVERPSAASVAA